MSVTTLRKKATEGIAHYRFVEKVGDGGMGTVYKAIDTKTEDIVAVKVLHMRIEEDSDVYRRFQQEFRAAAKLEHPNIVRAIDFGMDDGKSYLVSEFVDGKSLGQILDERVRLPEEEAIRIITQVAQALHYAHTGRVIHRDVKPDNILIRKDGMAKLLDFGLAKDWDDDRNLTRPLHGLGTPHFMAPEQYQDAKNAGVGCDIYALGATLYNVVTGRLPFDDCSTVGALAKKAKGSIPSPKSLVPELSYNLDDAVRQALDPNPERRPSSCLEFFRLLARPTRPRFKPSGPADPADDRRDNTRHAITMGTSCIVETDIHGDAEGSQESWPLLIRNVSLRGLGILLARRFEPGTELTVCIPAGPVTRARTLRARVVRVEPDSLGHWVHGCLFAQELAQEELASLLRQAPPARMGSR